LSGLSGSMIDPSLPSGARTVSKIGIDATLPQSEFPGAPKPTLPRLEVPKDATRKALSAISGANNSEWPEL